MKVKEITSAIEAFAPLRLQAGFDNSGLIIGSDNSEVNGAVLAVDLCDAVIDRAIELGVNMIITHHPIIFSALKRFNSRSNVERCVERAIRCGIVVYAAHTNLDSAKDGLSWRIAQIMGLSNIEVLSITDAEAGAGFGVIGEYTTAQSFDEVAGLLADRFSLSMLRHSRVVREQIRRVAICSGSGGSLMGEVLDSECDLYVTADLRYDSFLDAQGRVTIVDIGHFESEYCAIDLIFDILSKKMFNFALYKTEQVMNPVSYKLFG